REAHEAGWRDERERCAGIARDFDAWPQEGADIAAAILSEQGDAAYCTSRTQGATVSSAGEMFAPGRLWSLLDMLEHRAKSWQRVNVLLMRRIASLNSLP